MIEPGRAALPQLIWRGHRHLRPRPPRCCCGCGCGAATAVLLLLLLLPCCCFHSLVRVFQKCSAFVVAGDRCCCAWIMYTYTSPDGTFFTCFVFFCGVFVANSDKCMPECIWPFSSLMEVFLVFFFNANTRVLQFCDFPHVEVETCDPRYPQEMEPRGFEHVRPYIRPIRYTAVPGGGSALRLSLDRQWGNLLPD